MKTKQISNGILLLDARNFNIEEILECGQCFRFEKIDEGHYLLVALGRILYVRQRGNEVIFEYPDAKLTLDEFARLWIPYFDLGRDYGAILAKICHDDPVMAKAAAFAPGIRILQQEPWEMLISFIISQNNRIPQIKKIIKSISERFGEPIRGGFYAFPTLEEFAAATDEDLRECKAGFRAKYLLSGRGVAAAGGLPLSRDTTMPTGRLREALLKINGVGEKVAHCILLFGYGRFETFPVDTWVQKVMTQYYFDGRDAKVSDIHNLAKARFGELSGFAQQYLFHYIRLSKDV